MESAGVSCPTLLISLKSSAVQRTAVQREANAHANINKESETDTGQRGMFLSLRERGQSQLTTGPAVSLCPDRAVSCGTTQQIFSFGEEESCLVAGREKGSPKIFLMPLTQEVTLLSPLALLLRAADNGCRMGRTSLSLCQASQGHRQTKKT